MPLVNWSDATPADLAGFTVDYLREELARRNLDATGSKEEIISRLIADIAQNRPTTPPLPSPDSAASTQRCNAAPLPPSLDAAQTTELLTATGTDATTLYRCLDNPARGRAGSGCPRPENRVWCRATLEATLGYMEAPEDQWKV
ncbi:hypothetical protein HPB49_005093 [Dermacentor silvarum]|uniref:Uncharacterized protein n=1 Tax=Dermacentor silvarum TaxID=543639 RepID=A0ACB8DN27_DERSI|nr:hypothetical protein HPB49_005093 [Dermacentor silvarum]